MNDLEAPLRSAPLLALLLAACGAAPTPRAERPDPLAALTLPALPDWTNPYAQHDRGDMRFFRVEALMERYGVDRLTAVEIQNRYRDLTRADEDGDRAVQFERAVAEVRGGQRESGLDPEALAKADFIVVFDLDDTLYDQYHATADCHDLAWKRSDGSTKYIKLTPGWDAAIRRVHELGGLVVLFSANRDETNYANFARWTLDGRPLHESPLVAGVMTNSYLILQHKADGDPVVTPSKDLRLLDPTLERVIIVDDNPTRLFQMRNVRVFKKFRAPDYCGTGDADRRRAYERALPEVVREIEESLTWARAQGVPFARAYLPYTVLGRHAVDLVRAAHGWPLERAVEYVRRHPDLADEAY